MKSHLICVKVFVSAVGESKEEGLCLGCAECVWAAIREGGGTPGSLLCICVFLECI